MKLTLVINRGESGYFIGKIKEMPAVITQGKTLEEVKENIQDALNLYLEDMREEDSSAQETFITEEPLVA